MARDRDQASTVVFDLVDDDAADPDVPLAQPRYDRTHDADEVDDGDDGASDSDEAEAGAPSPSGSLGRNWRRAAPIAAVLAIALGTGWVADGARDAARIERIRGIQGGVVDVSAPLEEEWAWDGIVGAGDSWYSTGSEVAVLGDVLAFESAHDLVALDPATGEEAWSVPLGDDPECGPIGASAFNETTAISVMVCLQGAGTDREAMVVGADGAVSAPRALDPSAARRYGSPRPGPDGTVLRATRVGPESAVDLGDAECNDMGECTGTVEAGRDVVLRAEDARTGEERWSVTIPFSPATVDQCWTASWEDSGSTIELEEPISADGFSARITADLVNLSGCGVEASVTAQGVVLGTEFEPGAGTVESLRAGGYAGLDFGRTRTVLYSDDGGVVGELSGYVLGPGVADGSGTATLLGTDDSGQNLRAYDADGTPRWDVRAQSDMQPFLAQVGKTAVVAMWGRTVRGLDVATGEERWRWDGPLEADGKPYAGAFVSQTFTDGQAVLLLLTRSDSDVSRMVSLDAASGEVLWEESDEAATDDADSARPGAALVAVDGRLMEITRSGVRGLG